MTGNEQTDTLDHTFALDHSSRNTDLVGPSIIINFVTGGGKAIEEASSFSRIKLNDGVYNTLAGSKQLVTQPRQWSWGDGRHQVVVAGSWVSDDAQRTITIVVDGLMQVSTLEKSKQGIHSEHFRRTCRFWCEFVKQKQGNTSR